MPQININSQGEDEFMISGLSRGQWCFPARPIIFVQLLILCRYVWFALVMEVPQVFASTIDFTACGSFIVPASVSWRQQDGIVIRCSSVDLLVRRMILILGMNCLIGEFRSGIRAFGGQLGNFHR